MKLAQVLDRPIRSGIFVVQRPEHPAFARIWKQDGGTEWIVDNGKGKVMRAWSSCMGRPRYKIHSIRQWD